MNLRLLDGHLALDLTGLRGQFCGKILHGLGMDVIKVEPPDGDAVRRLGPFKDDVPGIERSLRFAYLNAGKKSLTLDLEHDEGRALLLRLVEQVDVVIESDDPGCLAKKGIGADTMRARNAGLVVTSVTSFGQDGPYRDYLAPDLVTFAMGGLMYIAGDPANPPVNAPETQGFYYPCVHAALGTLAALWRRGDSGANGGGVGQNVDVAAQEALATQEHLIRIFGSLGKNVERQGSQHPFAAPANIFPTKDGYVFLFASRVHWAKLLAVWPDHPPEFAEPEWEPDIFRRNNMERVNSAVAAFTSRYTKEEFALLMQKNGIACLQVNAPGEFARDEHLAARELLHSLDHAQLGAYRQIAFPVLVDGARAPSAPAPLLGEHTAALLGQRLGLSTADIALLFAHKVI